MAYSLKQKLEILADAAKYDASCASSGSNRSNKKGGLGNTQGSGICHSYTPDGRCISLLKILLTNFCIFDCKYCINRISSDVPRARFSVDEVIKLTLDFYRRNYIEGLFLSSGIIQTPDYTMEHLIKVAKSLRLDHHFNGYIHLKAIPGASDELLNTAGLYADRISVNIELPTTADLKKLAPEKNQQQLENNMHALKTSETEIKADKIKGMKAPKFIPGGQSSQMIVGATKTSDKAILNTSVHLYKNYALRRVYYSAFSPIPFSDKRLPVFQPPLLREHRLYQADWLLRFYGFGLNEILPEHNPHLSLKHDPKMHWALLNPEYFPIDVNRATKEQLLRIPGVGVSSVNKILQIRRHHRIRYQDLVSIRVSLKRAKYFLNTLDYYPKTKETQLEQLLFEPEQLALF